MVHCFITGVQCHLDKAFVLNRREARDLLNEFKSRVASLQRVIDQFSPLDEPEANAWGPGSQHAPAPRKRHRLVCKAVADALDPGFPEIELFLDWPEYQSRIRTVRANARPKKQAATQVLSEHEKNKSEP